MRDLLLHICLLSISLAVYTQESKSLMRYDASVNEYDIDALLDSAHLIVDFDQKKAFDYVEKALELSISSNNRHGEALCNVALGKINHKLEQYDLALDYYKRSLRLSHLLNKEELNTLYYNLAASYEKLENYQLSLEYYRKYQEYAESINDTEKVVGVKYDLARVNTTSNNYAEALQEYSSIQSIEEKRSNDPGIIYANTKMGDVNQMQGQPSAAIDNFKKSVEVAERSKNKKAKSRALRKLGDAYEQNQQYDEVLAARKQSLEISKEENELSEVAEDNLAIGEVFIAQNKPEQALEYIQQSLKITEETKDFEKKGKVLKSLSRAYKESGDYEKALLAYRDYTAAVDSTYKKRELELRTNLDMLATVNRKLQRIDLLEQDFEINRRNLELLEKEQLVNSRELKTQKRISYALILITLIISIASLFVYKSALQKRKANQLLALKSLRSQMNPHFIFNSLNSVNNYIAQSNERLANKYLSEFSQLMRSVLENSKHDFVPFSSEVDILRLYIKLEHSRFQDKFDYDFIIDESINQGELEIPPMLIQPYIENAVWHGLRYKEEKGFLKVELTKEENSLKVIIEDNGIGRKKSQELKTRHQKSGASTGLKNTKQRLNIINQMYKTHYSVLVEDLNKEEESGTRVEIRIPVNKQNT